ncbi:hypothetical protein M2311_002432 [Rhizobium leguminosarum]|jgi:hypothetical protein|nr:hypothetical protein [Rhizobium leguminosarum]MDH6272358.1 hypothetical protein [Rhizobium leguminosarum]
MTAAETRTDGALAGVGLLDRERIVAIMRRAFIFVYNAV